MFKQAMLTLVVLVAATEHLLADETNGLMEPTQYGVEIHFPEGIVAAYVPVEENEAAIDVIVLPNTSPAQVPVVHAAVVLYPKVIGFEIPGVVTTSLKLP